ncbi:MULTISPECIES: hypothetical protein [unclassified Streptomyces]|uniref:hypothetical protein n=1 Tax=unclassified Streptomyces TaxID=2593676 RepID=UPI0036E205F6
MQYPYVEISARDVTEPEGGLAVLVQFQAEGPGVPGVTEQDVVDAVKAHFAGLPNVSVTATRYEVTSSTV